MVNSNTSFGKLNKVVVGRELQLERRLSDITFRQFYREAIGEKIYESPIDEYHVTMDLIDLRNKELDDLEKTLSKYCKVYRPEPLTKIIPFSTPSFKSELSSASNVRDLTLVYNDKLIETPTFVRNRYYENTLLYDVYDEVTGGHNWIKAPHTKLTEDTIDLEHWGDKRDYNNPPKNYVMAIDGAQFLRIGRDCIVNVNSYNHYKGYQWVKSFFPETDFHMIHVADNHIDGAIVSLCPGKFLVDPKYKGIEKLMPDQFKNWEYLYPENLTEEYNGPDIEMRLASSRGMDINVLSIDENTVVVNKRAVGVKDILDKHGFNVIEVTLENGEIFAGGIHCSTLDLDRDDEYIYY